MRQGMRVLAAHPSPDGYGADLMLAVALRGLRDRGVDVRTTVPGDGPLVTRLRGDGVEVDLLGVPVLRKAALRPAGLVRLLAGTAPALVRMVRLIRRVRPSVVYVNTLTIPLWFVAARIARVPVVCHVREAEDGIPRWLERLLTAPLLLVRQVLANSQHTADRLAASWPRLRARTSVVYNGFDLAEGEPPPPPGGGAHAELVVVGRLSPRKGQHVAIAALDQVVRSGHDARLRLVGTEFAGYEWYVAELRSDAARLGVADRVRFDGYRADTASVYAEADVVLVPSLVEPFGNVAVEAQLAGRPVVASRTGGLAEIVQHDHTGLLVAPDDPGALADAIERILDDDAARAAMAERAATSARARFGLERYQQEVAHHLDEAARRW